MDRSGSLSLGWKINYEIEWRKIEENGQILLWLLFPVNSTYDNIVHMAHEMKSVSQLGFPLQKLWFMSLSRCHWDDKKSVCIISSALQLFPGIIFTTSDSKFSYYLRNSLVPSSSSINWHNEYRVPTSTLTFNKSNNFHQQTISKWVTSKNLFTAASSMASPTRISDTGLAMNGTEILIRRKS